MRTETFKKAALLNHRIENLQGTLERIGASNSSDCAIRFDYLAPSVRLSEETVKRVRAMVIDDLSSQLCEAQTEFADL